MKDMECKQPGQKVKVLVDTNVLMDVLAKRIEFYDDSAKVFSFCANGKSDGYIAAHSIPDIFYLMRKEFDEKQRRQMLLSLFDCFSVSGLDADKIISALERDGFKNFEDCLQDECAQAVHADFIITRNTGDYVTSSVKAITPGDFIKFVG